MKESKVLSGVAIVVLDRGFVYVGEVEISETSVVIRKAQNIRVWGTDRGLGQLAIEGPNSKTTLDQSGTIRAPIHALIHTIDTEASLWKL